MVPLLPLQASQSLVCNASGWCHQGSSALLAGIGRSIVKALHVAGARVVAVSRTQADLDSLVREVGAALSQPRGLHRGAEGGPSGTQGSWALGLTKDF